MSETCFSQMLDMSENYFFIVGIVARVLAVSNWKITSSSNCPSKQWPRNSFKWAIKAHQTILLSAQKLDNDFRVPQSYVTKKINGIVCTSTNFGDYLDLTRATLTLPIVQNKKLARKMAYTIHMQAIPIPGKNF